MGKDDRKKEEEAMKQNLTHLLEVMSNKTDELDELIRERKVRAAEYYSGRDPRTGMRLREVDSIICACCEGFSTSIEWMVANEIFQTENKILQQLVSIPKWVREKSYASEARGEVDLFYRFDIDFFNVRVRRQRLVEDVKRDASSDSKQDVWRDV